MSSAMDKALLELSLDEPGEPFVLPDEPEFCSSENNVISLIGRLLNPDKQNMANLILDMPHKWQKYDKVRGIVLTKEKFQFILKNEHDLIEVLDKGVQTYDDWAIAIERWTKNPPEDYLQYVFIWVQIRNIPVNHYTKKAITALGELVGLVVEVAFDPTKSQRQDYVRVLVKFDVSKPLRKSKEITLPKGEKTTIYFYYEKIQRRCYCQRLTHDQHGCLIRLRREENQSVTHQSNSNPRETSSSKGLEESDPLFGVLQDEQIGIQSSVRGKGYLLRILCPSMKEQRKQKIRPCANQQLVRKLLHLL